MKRTGLLAYLILIIGVIYIGRLFYLQVIENPYKIPTLNNSAVKLKYEYPERGYVYDRNGKLLVANQLSYDIMVILREVNL